MVKTPKNSHLRLLPHEDLIKTGPVDKAEWNYSPILGMIQRSRFHLALHLLGGYHFHRLLEIGYASGVFMPELTQYCDQLYGVDIHHDARSVAKALNKHGTVATLAPASPRALPFRNASIDCVVAISTLEYLDHLDEVCQEIRRVLTSHGQLFAVIPGHSPVIDLGLFLLTGTRAEEEYRGRRQRVIPTLKGHFVIEEELAFHPLPFPGLCLYRALRLRPIGIPAMKHPTGA